MKPEEKTSKLISNLINKTASGMIEWTSHKPKHTELPGGEIILDKVYKANISERTFQLFRYTFKTWRAENEFEWQQSIRLALLDENGNIDYQFEYDTSFIQLYDAVRMQCSSVISIADNIDGRRLEITSATYGTEKKFIDVTQEVIEKISNGKLTIRASNEIKGDPAPNAYSYKYLRVHYRYYANIGPSMASVSEGNILTL